MVTCLEQPVELVTVEAVCGIASEVLANPKVQPDDDLFTLGLNSILVLSLISKLKQQTQLDQIPIQVMFRAPTPRKIAELLNQSAQQQK